MMIIKGWHDSNGNVAAVLPIDLADIVDRHQDRFSCRGKSWVAYILRQLGTLTREKGSPERGWRFRCEIDEDLLRGALGRLDRYREWLDEQGDLGAEGWALEEWLTGKPHDWNR
jgi:hypothetical protein